MEQFKILSTDTAMYQVLQDYRIGRENFSLRVGKSSGEGFTEVTNKLDLDFEQFFKPEGRRVLQAGQEGSTKGRWGDLGASPYQGGAERQGSVRQSGERERADQVGMGPQVN